METQFIMPCSCTSGEGAKYQDQRYGKGKRVWNRGNGKRTCTCCGKVETDMNLSLNAKKKA